MEIRPWDDADLDWWVGLRRQWLPEMGEAQVRLLGSGRVARFIYRTVAWEGGDRLGSAMVFLPPDRPRAVAQVLVAPDARGKGVGSRLWADLTVTSADRELTAGMPDNDPTSREVAEHWGFHVVSHAIRSRLDFNGLSRRAPAPDPFSVRMVQVSDLPEAKHGVELVLSESNTSPEAVELGLRHTVGDLERMFPSILWVLIEEQGAPVAVASTQPQNDQAWLVIYTGVVPSHRRRGLARLAKQHLHAIAASQGAGALVTNNEVRNTAMLAVNNSLGYQRIGGELRLIRIP
jgi:GNAT superfamily N-acetyltransferase